MMTSPCLLSALPPLITVSPPREDPCPPSMTVSPPVSMADCPVMTNGCPVARCTAVETDSVAPLGDDDVSFSTSWLACITIELSGFVVDSPSPDIWNSPVLIIFMSG